MWQKQCKNYEAKTILKILQNERRGRFTRLKMVKLEQNKNQHSLVFIPHDVKTFSLTWSEDVYKHIRHLTLPSGDQRLKRHKMNSTQRPLTLKVLPLLVVVGHFCPCSMNHVGCKDAQCVVIVFQVFIWLSEFHLGDSWITTFSQCWRPSKTPTMHQALAEHAELVMCQHYSMWRWVWLLHQCYTSQENTTQQ